MGICICACVYTHVFISSILRVYFRACSLQNARMPLVLSRNDMELLLSMISQNSRMSRL